jgi:hypothetical protein
MRSFVVLVVDYLFLVLVVGQYNGKSANQDTQRKYFKLLPPQKEQKNGWLL